MENLNTTNLSFKANVNLGQIANKVKNSAEIKKAFSLATKNCPRDELCLNVAEEGSLTIQLFDKSQNLRSMILAPSELNKLIKNTQEAFTERLLLAYETLKTGLMREKDTCKIVRQQIKNGIMDEGSPQMYHIFDKADKMTKEVMQDMVAGDRILSKAKFID